MKPYYEFAKDKNSRENMIAVKFNNGIIAAIVDFYCINPNCNCSEVGLDFVEGMVEDPLFKHEKIWPKAE